MTLGNMQDRIADELARTDLASQILLEIQSAVNHYAGERWWFAEVHSQTLTLTSSVEEYALPADMAGLDDMQLYYSSDFLELDRRDYKTIREWQSGNTYGPPTDYAIYADSVVVFPIPLESLNLMLSYHQELASLSATTDTNVWMTYGEELIRARARAAVQINYLRDEGATAEYMAMGQLDPSGGFLSRREMAAYRSLKKRSGKRISQGFLSPSDW